MVKLAQPGKSPARTSVGLFYCPRFTYASPIQICSSSTAYAIQHDAPTMRSSMKYGDRLAASQREITRYTSGTLYCGAQRGGGGVGVGGSTGGAQRGGRCPAGGRRQVGGYVAHGAARERMSAATEKGAGGGLGGH